MKTSSASARENHVKVSLTIGESKDFRNYLALSRDSYPMGLGRLVAVCLFVLTSERTHFSHFELDRAVQWPADRPQTFAAILEQVGWARPRPQSRTLVELMLPADLMPRRPLKQRTKFRAVRPRNEDGQFASREQLAEEVLMWKNRRVVLIDLDGCLRTDLQSFSEPEKPSNVRRRSRGETS